MSFNMNQSFKMFSIMRWMSLGGFVVAVGLLLSGCGDRSRPADITVFRFSENGAPISMDPAQGATQYANLMITSIYDTLYEYKYLARPYEMKPSLAEAMPEVSEDGLVYTIRIRKGVRFADNPCFVDGKGREVTAHDFVYSVKRMFDPKNLPQGAWLWQGRIKGIDEWKSRGSNYAEEIEGLQAVDPYTIRIEVKEPYPQLIYTLAMGYSAVVPREAVAHYGKEFGIRPVGSGPFTLESFDTKKAILKRNPNYREEIFDLDFEGYDPDTQAFAELERLQGRRLPIMDNVEVHFVEEPMTRWTSFTKGNEIQFSAIPLEVNNAVAESFKPLVLKPAYAQRFKGMNLPDFGLVYYVFNMEDPEIGYNPDPDRNHRNLLLRRAIRAAIDWDQRDRRFYNGVSDLFPGILTPELDAYDPDRSRDVIKADYALAMSLLEEGGWNAENVPVLFYDSVAGVREQQFFEQFRGWMEKMGYPAERVRQRTYANFGDFNRAIKEKECMIFGLGWGMDYPDSENVLQLFYGPNKSPGSNSANFDDPRYNELFRKAKTMQPSPGRTAIYRELNEILIDQVPVLAGLTRNSPYVWHNNVVYYPSRNPHGSLLKYALVYDPATDPSGTAPGSDGNE